LLLTYILTAFTIETKFVPTFMWSGKKEYFGSKYQHETQCSIKNIKDQILYGTFNQNTPKYILGFFNENFESKDFRNAASSFKQDNNGGSFANLMKILQEKSESSIVYPTCSIEYYEKIDDLLSRLSVTVATEKKN